VLAEGATTADALSLLRSRGGAVVACSHGDVIPAVVEALAEQGLEILDPPVWKKGSTWLLERDGGLFTSARYLGMPPSAP
jgi:8-oxo-dGTP diphosphatase